MAEIFMFLRKMGCSIINSLRCITSFANCTIIHERENADDISEDELEDTVQLQSALRMGISTIVIENASLGEEIAHWIYIGNFLHKTSVISGLLCITINASQSYWTSAIIVPGLVSLGCTALYMLSWQYDPCCKYQPETDPFRLKGFPIHALRSRSPLVLVKHDDGPRKVLHSLMAGLSACIVLVRIIQRTV